MIYSQHLKKLALLISIALLTHYTYGQELKMQDILDMYPLDSISLKKACADKNFSLRNINEDIWIFSYTFRDNNTDRVSLNKTFPKDTSANKFLSYSFDSNKRYRDLKRQLKESGFAFTRESSKDYGSIAYYREYFRNDIYEIMLVEGRQHEGPHSFTLMLYQIPLYEK